MSPFVIVVTCSPTEPSLRLDELAACEALIGLDQRVDPQWLNPGIACEIKITIEQAQRHQLIDALRTELAAIPCDVNLVEDSPERRKRLLIADMDATMIRQECIDEIAALAGVGNEVARITEQAMRGELDFEPALRSRVSLLKGLSQLDLERVIEERIELMPGAQALVATMAAQGAYCALVSGGFTFFTSRIAARLGFHENRANTLEFNEDSLTGDVVDPVLGREAKLAALEDLMVRRRLTAAQCLAVGDGANDLAMINRAGLGVAYRAKPMLAEQAAVSIDHCDLTGLLYLQGYTSDDFIATSG